MTFDAYTRRTVYKSKFSASNPHFYFIDANDSQLNPETLYVCRNVYIFFSSNDSMTSHTTIDPIKPIECISLLLKVKHQYMRYMINVRSVTYPSTLTLSYHRLYIYIYG